jgi:cytochrome bd-type quinol oxidase subunit 2
VSASSSKFRPTFADFDASADHLLLDGEAESLENSKRKSESYWRIYFMVHLLVIIATAVVMTHETASSTHRGTWRDIVLPLGPALMPVACVGAPLALVTPAAAVFFLSQIRGGGWRAMRAAMVAVSLTAIHHFTLLPTVQ